MVNLRNTKKMDGKDKKDKRKTLEERTAIVQDIKARISTQLLIDIDTYESHGMQQFAKVLEEYSGTPTLLSGFTGKIFIDEIDRFLYYILPVSKHASHLVTIQSPQLQTQK